MEYSPNAKSARMSAILQLIPTGNIEIGTALMGKTGTTGVLVKIPLDVMAGTVFGDTLTLSGFPKYKKAIGKGIAALARLTDSTGATVISGLTVGTIGTDIILDNTAIVKGQRVTLEAFPTLIHAV